MLWNDCAWSVKTVKASKPFEISGIRVISGRNSPSYSSEISDPFADIQATGRAILDIWNGRVDIAAREHDDLRIMIMIRNMRKLEFTLMEHEGTRFVASDYEWKSNERKNLLGFDKSTGVQRFTWQHSGSQFTIHHHVPASAHCFRIEKRPGVIPEAHVLRIVQFDDSWIVAVPRVEEGKIIDLPKG